MLQVSWGTKGSDKAEALPSVSSKKSEGADAPAVEDTVKPQQDVDDAFKETVTRAITKVKVVEVPEKPTMDDQNKTFRTRLVAMWMLSNAGLAIAIENLNGLPNESDPEADEDRLRTRQNTYFAIILYSTFGLSLVRFIGVSYRFCDGNIPLCSFFPSACSTSSSGICSGAVAGTRSHLSIILLSLGFIHRTLLCSANAFPYRVWLPSFAIDRGLFLLVR